MRAAARNWIQGTQFHSPVCWPASHTLRGVSVVVFAVLWRLEQLNITLMGWVLPLLWFPQTWAYTLSCINMCVYIFCHIHKCHVPSGLWVLLYCGDYCSRKLSGHWNPMLDALPWHFKSYPDTGTQCYMRYPDILKVILTLEPNATCVALTF